MTVVKGESAEEDDKLKQERAAQIEKKKADGLQQKREKGTTLGELKRQRTVGQLDLAETLKQAEIDIDLEPSQVPMTVSSPVVPSRTAAVSPSTPANRLSLAQYLSRK